MSKDKQPTKPEEQWVGEHIKGKILPGHRTTVESISTMNKIKDHMEVHLIAYTPDPDHVCGVAALGDRDSRPAFKLCDEDWEGALVYATNQDHMGIVEHASFTFMVGGVSRALTHQLVRHRMASYDQQSQRAVTFDEPTVVTPPNVTGNVQAKLIYEQIMGDIWTTYNELIGLGIPPEDARFILPNACTSNITITMNARSLLHFFELRCCLSAQWEIRNLANRMLKLCKEAAPIIFRNAGPPCSRCPQPDVECERKPRVLKGGLK